MFAQKMFGVLFVKTTDVKEIVHSASESYHSDIYATTQVQFGGERLNFPAVDFQWHMFNTW